MNIIFSTGKAQLIRKDLRMKL